MPKDNIVLPKPRSEVVNPEITRLAQLNLGRKKYRALLRWFSKLLVLIWTRVEVEGIENIPEEGPILLTQFFSELLFYCGPAYRRYRLLASAPV